MGNWSPYSDEWEQQRIQKALGQMAEDCTQKRAAFERLPSPIQALLRSGRPFAIILISPLSKFVKG